MKIIVNADDFGASERINNAIVDAFKKGIVTNTTIMPNMSAYDEAVELAKENGFFDKVGIHLNLLAGEPLTLSIKQEPLLYDSETNRLTSKYILNKKNIFLRFFLPSHTKKALKKEAEAQILKYIGSGFTLMHLDSHIHAHTFPAFYFSVKKVIKQYKFKTIRKSLNFSLSHSRLILAYKALFNKIAFGKFKTTCYFTSVVNFVHIAKAGLDNKDCTCELMIHPIYKDGKFTNNESVSFEELSDILKNHTLISYKDI